MIISASASLCLLGMIPRVRIVCVFVFVQPAQSKKDKAEPNFMGLIEHLAATNEKAFGMTLFLIKAQTSSITPETHKTKAY